MSVPARRRQVAYGRERGLSARRACTLFSVARSALEYRSRKAAKDAPVVTRMKELSAQYPRYGYRRIRIFLNRDGHRMSPAPAVANGKAAGAAQPHSSLGYLTPNEFVARLPKAASRHATGQDAAVCGPSRPGPLHNPLRKEHMHEARDAISS